MTALLQPVSRKQPAAAFIFLNQKRTVHCADYQLSVNAVYDFSRRISGEIHDFVKGMDTPYRNPVLPAQAEGSGEGAGHASDPRL